MISFRLISSQLSQPTILFYDSTFQTKSSVIFFTRYDCMDELLIDYNPKTRSLFYDHDSMILVEDNDNVKSKRLEFKEELKVEDDNYRDHLNHSTLSLPDQRERFQLEKASIIWKIKIE